MRFTVTIAAYFFFGSVLYSGISHLLHTTDFKQALGQQRIWPAFLESVIVVMATAAELLVGLTGGLALVIDAFPADLVGLATRFGAILLGGYTIYALLLLRHRPGAPCACSGTDEVSIWVAVRAALLGSAALLVTLESGTVLVPGWSPETMLWVLASLGISVIVWNLPAALRQPYRSAMPGAEISLRLT